MLWTSTAFYRCSPAAMTAWRKAKKHYNSHSHGCSKILRHCSLPDLIDSPLIGKRHCCRVFARQIRAAPRHATVRPDCRERAGQRVPSRRRGIQIGESQNMAELLCQALKICRCIHADDRARSDNEVYGQFLRKPLAPSNRSCSRHQCSSTIPLLIL